MAFENKSRIVFYLDKRDKELLQDECTQLRVKASFYIRNCVLEKLGNPVMKVTSNNIEVKHYTNRLLQIGNNLNQIAKKLNSGAKFMIADQQAVLSEIENVKKHIVEINSKIK